MARQILRWVGITLTSDGERFTWDATDDDESGSTDLGSEDESQSIPTFSNTPIVKLIPRGDRRIVAIQTTRPLLGFNVQVGAEGDDNLPITFDVELVNRDSESVTGPTPDTDFTSSLDESLCTPLDILLEHDQLTPQVISFAVLQQKCLITRKMVNALSVYYSEANLKTDPWVSMVIPSAVWDARVGGADSYGNRGASLAIDTINQAGVRAITPGTDNTTVFTDMYTITFTSSTAFSITGLIAGSVGSGTTSSDFTAGNGDFSIDSEAWYGTFEKDHKFYFSLYTFYHRIVRLATAAAVAMILWPRYGKDNGPGALSTAGGYFKEHMDGMKALLKPDAKGGERLPSLGNRTFTPKVLPYDVSWLGLDMTKVPSDNKDDDGERGEISGIFNLNRESDYYYY